MSEEEMIKEAEKIAREKVSFLIHFGVYLIVNVFVAIIWLITSGPDSYPWFIWMTAGWGIGVAAHFLATYIDVGLKEKYKVKEYQRLKGMQK
ncbi:MAG: 2TM domain-containing protein [Thermoplasmata archaeon]|nr:2TM domain-containing protein [Thermoplasmata archaeon]